MSYKAARTMRKLKHINGWGILAGFIFVFLLLIVGYYVYMKMQFSDLQEILTAKQQTLQEKNKEYKDAIDDPRYKKYQAAKVLYKDDKFINRKKTIVYLIDVFNEIRDVDDHVSGVTLDDFQVSIDGNVHLAGTVQDLHYVYIYQGLLDQFLNFDFIEELNVPFYKEYENSFEFVLDAIIKSHDRNKQSGSK